MSGFKTYREGTPFPGRIGRTLETSEAAWPVGPRAKKGAPNILVILLDDVGFAQLGCYGSDIRTPNCDRLAANGLRYRDFHTTAICSPTRVSLLTGRNPHSNGVDLIQESATGFPGYNGYIPKTNGFISEILLEHGYATYALGKWHLTTALECAAGATKARWPLARGFENFYGFLGGKTSQWAPALVRDNHCIEPPRTPTEGYHFNADLADQAITQIGNLRALTPEKPFFMYYCPGAGHSPHHVEQKWIDGYRGRFDMGWNRWREQVFERQLAMGIVPPGTQIASRPDQVKAWDSLTPEAQRLYARQMEVYAGFLEQTDHHIGRVLDFLEQIGELDNTLVMLASDNGASAEGGEHGQFNSAQFANKMDQGVAEQLPHLDEWGGVNSYPNYAWGWAWAGNTPLRRWKRYLHQGGMSDPLIVHWPHGITGRNEIRDQYVHVTDVLPTLLEVLGIAEPTILNGIPQRPIEGVSFAHTFNDAEAPTRKHVQYYEMIGSRALWMDGWKAIVEQPQGEYLTEAMLDQQMWELYHVAEDFSEAHDLADKHPEKLAALIDQWWVEAGKYNVLPLDARLQARMSERKPDLRPPGNTHVYYRDNAPLFDLAAVDVKNRSHRIVAEVELPEAGAEGVLLAHGSWFAGYSFYVQNRRLHYVHNYLGLAEYHVASDEELPAGKLDLEMRFDKTGDHQGQTTLLCNGRAIGAGAIPQTVPHMIEMSSEGLCCGWDSGLPVTRDYAAPFRFTGTLRKVVVTVDGPVRNDPEAQWHGALENQ